MNFLPALAAKILRGEKTVTRRIASTNPRSPWWEGGCSLAVGQDYAVCPGRGKHAVGRIRIAGTRLIPLGRLTEDEACHEGFPDVATFEVAWSALNGTYDPGAMVWRVEFMLCAEGER